MSSEVVAGLAGGALGVAGGVLITLFQILYDRSKQKTERNRKLAEQRRIACVNLLSETRRLRQITLRTFQRRKHENDVDEVYAKMYSALYTVKAICPKEVADLAQIFFDEAKEFWQLSINEPRAPERKWQRKREKVKNSVQNFRAAIRQEFAASIDENLDELDYR